MILGMIGYWAIAIIFGILFLGTIAFFSVSTVVAQENNGTEISNSASTTDTLTSSTVFKRTITSQMSSDDSL